MEGWTQRLFATLVLAAIALVVAFVLLWLGMGSVGAAVVAIALFAMMVTVQLVVEMRRDLLMLKNQALELSGYESEITRRVDYLASLVERSGGAAPDELAKRVRTINQQYAELTLDMGARLDRIEEELAERAIPPARASAGGPDTAAAPRPARPAFEASGEAKAEPEARPATVIPMPRPGTRPAAARGAPERPARPTGDGRPAAEWRRDIAGDRLTFHLLPALALPERKPILYEAVMRIARDDGSWLEPEEVLQGAAAHGLAALVERKTLYTAARMLRAVRRMGKEMRLIAPLSLSYLADERGFGELRSFLKAAPDLREGLALEIAQKDFRSLSSEARQRIGQIADAGFALSLGRLHDRKTDPATLRQLGFTLARAPASLVTLETREPGEPSLAVALAAHRIDLVVTDVADEATTLTLIDQDVTIAQGPALSAPRLVKSDLLQAPVAAKAAAATEATANTAGPTAASPTAASPTATSRAS